VAVYEGARPQPLALPRRRNPTRARARVRAHRRRSSPLGLSLAAIAICFLLALFYLAQTMHVAATGYDVDSLLLERERLIQQIATLEGDIHRWGAEPAVVKEATEMGLDRLGRPVRLPGR
jgi:hypothetical protein